MTRIAIVGGHGQIARLLIPLLVDAGHVPVALVRNPDHGPELERLGAEVAHLDIEAAEEESFAEALTGADGNIERKRTVDLGGSLKSIAGAEQVGIRRFVQISAIGVDEPLPDDTSPVWAAYVEAKRDADIALRASGLDWTIIRPGGLTDDAPTGLVTLAETVERAQVTRADVASVVAAVIDDPATHGRQWELVGGSTPIADAIAAATR